MFIRKRLTYANIVATLALVFSMTGGAMATKHYLINSTQQINPKVIRALKGKPGRTGPRGSAGPEGKEGPAGEEGKEGAAGEVGTQEAVSSLGYAHVEGDGTIDAADTSSNITAANIKKVGIGEYEFTNLPFEVHSVTVTLGFGVEVNDDAYANASGSNSAEVALYDETGASADGNFYIVFN
jgi:hypothetical protein